MKRLLPNQSIGIIGGGQLGQMMALSAISSGYQINLLDPDENCPTRHLATHFIQAAYDDATAFEKLVAISDVVTYEFENVDAEFVERYVDKIPQGSKALRLSQHRFVEKEFAKSLNIPTPKYQLIQSQEELLKIQSFPVLIKTCRNGYDGKGQYKIESLAALNDLQLDFTQSYLAEDYCELKGECALVLTCFKDGITVYEPFETHHRSGILSSSIYPAQLDDMLAQQAVKYALKIAENLQTIGTLAIEFFITEEGLLFNEMAPRPHNSAHGTIEGSNFSQYDLHIAAITGSKKIEAHCIASNVLLNILGQDIPLALDLLEKESRVHAHFYSKKTIKENRKMGHLIYEHPNPLVLSQIADQWRMR